MVPDSPLCFDCSPGFFCPQGATDQIPCAPGSYAEQPRASECFLCAAGRSSAVIGAALRSQCTACVAGRFSVSMGSTMCSACPPGTSTSGAEGAVGCAYCSRGYASAGGQGSCSECEKGTYAAGEGAARCNQCPPGRYADGAKSDECRLCPLGRFLAGVGASAQSNCTSCTAVDKRFFSLAVGATSAAACAPCPAVRGNFTYNVRGEGCAPCKIGYFCDGSSTLQRCFGKQENCLGQAGCAPDFKGARCSECADDHFLYSEQLAWETGDPNATDVVKTCKQCPNHSSTWLLPIFILTLLAVPSALYACLDKCFRSSKTQTLCHKLSKGVNHINNSHGTFVSLLTLHVKFLNQLFASNMLPWPGEFKLFLDAFGGVPREGCLLKGGFPFFASWVTRGALILWGALFFPADYFTLSQNTGITGPPPTLSQNTGQPIPEPPPPSSEISFRALPQVGA